MGTWMIHSRRGGAIKQVADIMMSLRKIRKSILLIPQHVCQGVVEFIGIGVVGFHMSGQRVGMAKSYIANCTGERLPSRVVLHVRVQLLDLAETLIALTTSVRFLPRMPVHMSAKILSAYKLSVTFSANMRPRASMDPHVDF